MVSIERNRARMQELLDRVGGTTAVAKAVGASSNAIYIAKSRGHFPRSWKYDVMSLAGTAGVALPEEIFEKPVA